MRHRLAFPAFFSAIVLLLLLAGCWNPFKPPEKKNGNGGNGGGEILERTSPENVLNNLKVIYGDKDNTVNTADDAVYWAERYRELLHAHVDTFKFWFISGEQPPHLPEPWWGREDEVLSFEGLFRDVALGEVDNISLEWTVNPSGPDMRVDEQTSQLLHPHWKHIYVPSVYLDVVKGELVLTVPNGYADFYFGPDPTDPNLWVITEWYDGAPPTN